MVESRSPDLEFAVEDATREAACFRLLVARVDLESDGRRLIED